MAILRDTRTQAITDLAEMLQAATHIPFTAGTKKAIAVAAETKDPYILGVLSMGDENMQVDLTLDFPLQDFRGERSDDGNQFIVQKIKVRMNYPAIGYLTTDQMASFLKILHAAQSIALDIEEAFPLPLYSLYKTKAEREEQDNQDRLQAMEKALVPHLRLNAKNLRVGGHRTIEPLLGCEEIPESGLAVRVGNNMYLVHKQVDHGLFVTRTA